jgi:hypothetical protein
MILPFEWVVELLSEPDVTLRHGRAHPPRRTSIPETGGGILVGSNLYRLASRPARKSAFFFGTCTE